MISFDFNIVIQSGLTVEQYLFLYLLSQRNWDALNKYNESTKAYSKPFTIDLIDKGYIEYNEDLESDIKGDKLVVTDKFKNLVYNNMDDLFEKFWQVFPSEAPDGTKLKMEKQTCKKLFKDIIKANPIQISSHIISCLELEVVLRKRNNNLQFIKRSPAWLRGRYWEPYESDLEKLNLLKKQEQPVKQLNQFNG